MALDICFFLFFLYFSHFRTISSWHGKSAGPTIYHWVYWTWSERHCKSEQLLKLSNFVLFFSSFSGWTELTVRQASRWEMNHILTNLAQMLRCWQLNLWPISPAHSALVDSFTSFFCQLESFPSEGVATNLLIKCIESKIEHFKGRH